MSAPLKTFGYGLVVQFIYRCLLLLLIMFVAQIAEVSCFMAKVTFCIACWTSFISIVKVTSTSWALVLLLSSVRAKVGLSLETLLAFGLALISLITFLLRLLLSFSKIVNTLCEPYLLNVKFQTLKMSAYSESLLEGECDRHLE